MRTPSLYPPSIYLEKICESIEKLYSSDRDNSIELFFNNKDFLSKDLKKSEDREDIEEETDELDTSIRSESNELDELIGNDDVLSTNGPQKLRMLKALILNKRAKC